MPSDWLEQLKAGDTVIVDVGFSRDDFQTHIVERVTATQIIVAGNRYRKADGRRVGESCSWRINRLLEAIPERLDVSLRSKLIRQFRGTVAEKLSLDQLRRITAILEEPQP